MCKYCEFDLMQEPFTEEEIYRGDLFLHEKDSDMYIERTDIKTSCGEFYNYELITQLENRKKIKEEVYFCPKCGRKLPLNK